MQGLLGLFFVLTGASALLAEQAFEKMLSLLLGASTPAAATVLAVYFLGLSLGAGLYGRFCGRIKNAVLAFALLEGFVALWVLALYFGFDTLPQMFAPLLRLGVDSPTTLAALRGLIAIGWILPPTLCMGASFPAIVDAIATLDLAAPRRAIARIYSFNLLGALGGALIGPAIAFRQWGVDGTLLFAAALDGVVCLGALALALSRQPRAVAAAVGPGKLPTAAATKGIRLIVLVAALSGFLLFSLEVLWTHLLAAVLGNSVYVFAAMLAIVLAGLLAGAAISSTLFPAAQAVPAYRLSLVFSIGAACIAVQYLAWPDIPARFSAAGPGITSFLESEMFRWRLAAELLLPTATVIGMSYPLLFRLGQFPLQGQARGAALAAMANTLGCIAGALLTGFVLIPQLGSENSLKLFGVLAAACGGIIAAMFATGRQRHGLVLLSAASAVLFLLLPPWDRLALTSGEHVYFKRSFVWPQSRLEMFHEDTYGGMTTVVTTPVVRDGERQLVKSLLTNGKFQGDDAGEMDAQTGFALIPALLARRFDHACMIGLGTGRSAHVAQAFDFKRVDIAEIAPGIVVAAGDQFAQINGDLLRQPGVNLALEDGRNLLLLHDNWRCDLISMELTSIWFAGSTNLYSREFYQLARQRLAPQGIFQQWIQIHHIGFAEVGSVLATVQSVFPHVALWVFGGQGIIVAAEHPLEFNAAAQARFLASGSDIGANAGERLAMIDNIKRSQVLTPTDTRRLVAQGNFTVNTDRNRHLEYAAPRYNVSGVDHAAANLALLRTAAAGRALP